MRLSLPAALSSAVLACTASPGSAERAVAPDKSKILGTFECRPSSVAAVAADRPPHVEQSSAANPVVRITLTSLDENARAEIEWWNSKDNVWRKNRGDRLSVTALRFQEANWVVTLEGAFGRQFPVPTSAMLSNVRIDASKRLARPSDEHVLAFTQLAAFFASAGMYTCEKL